MAFAKARDVNLLPYCDKCLFSSVFNILLFGDKGKLYFLVLEVFFGYFHRCSLYLVGASGVRGRYFKLLIHVVILSPPNPSSQSTHIRHLEFIERSLHSGRDDNTGILTCEPVSHPDLPSFVISSLSRDLSTRQRSGRLQSR